MPSSIAKTVLMLATTSEFQTVTASPSLNSTRKLSSCRLSAYHTGGEAKISSGVLNEIMNSQ